jgi:hypothetical protein
MGSPFNLCDLQIVGEWVPSLPNEEWQDKTAQSPDGRFVALVAWAITNNEPGFCVYTIDVHSKSVSKSQRVQGCCEVVEWDANREQFSWRVART